MTIPKDKKELGMILQKAREAQKLTQEEVAKKAGIDVTDYARIEQGRVEPRSIKLMKILEVLNLQVP